MYTLDQVAGFVAVAEEGSFAGGAERLAMTQPPLSRQVQKLERDVGVPLLVRHHRGVRLTPAGRVFLAEARRLLDRAESARLTARSVADGTTGTVRIAFTAVAALTVLGPWVRALTDELPDVDLILTELVTGEQVEALLAGEIDVGLARGPARTPLLTARPVASETLVLAAPAGHPLTDLGHAPTLAEIAEHPLITYAPNRAGYLHNAVAAVFRDAHLTPRFVQHVAQVNSVLALVGAGLGVALVPESVAVMQSVSYVEVADMPEDTMQVHCVWRDDNDNPALARALLLVCP